MPFMGKDWRSPGEAWVKTESLGWQRMKIIESQLRPGCHQSPACSWPPKSQFGQHMENHCGRHEASFNRKEIRTENGQKHRDSISSGSGTSSSSSSNSSRANSNSPSPSSSPEKTQYQQQHMHHIHPLAISSPYGQYSWCNHHLDLNSQPTSPNYYTTKDDNNAQVKFSRSLSRESVRIAPIENNINQRKMYHNSMSDFRLSSDDNEQESKLSSTSQEWNATSCRTTPLPPNKMNITPPVLMKNGFKLDDSELIAALDVSTESLNTNEKDIRQNPTSQPPTNSCCCQASQTYKTSCDLIDCKPIVQTAPHCRISVRTREVAMYNTISEAFYRLDFCNAIHDIRRFNYICKLLHLLITQNLTSLSGCATKVLFTMLEQVAWEVSSNKRNIHVLKNLLNELKYMIQKYYCWGRPIGSSLLWQQHFDTIERISQIVDRIELSPPQTENTQLRLNDLPVEMIHEILLRLNDYRDLVNSAQASPVMRSMIDGQHIWKQMCKYHFTDQQMKLALENNGLFAKRGNVRNLKYARTISADGKTSFRNPINHKSKYGSTRQQLEQTSGRRVNRIRDNDPGSSSYVTKAIKIFDKQGTSTMLGSTKIRRSSIEQAKKEKQNVENPNHRESDLQHYHSQAGRTNEIDWQRVFHQLRKKFDLKEEYADCLLLCRHCRCLFWKSFGHPCIQNDDSQEEKCAQSDQVSARNNCSREVNHYPHALDRCEQLENRLSVAVLSRNFDNGFQNQDQENVPPRALNPVAMRNPRERRVNNNNRIVRLVEQNDRSNGRDDNNNPARSINRKTELVPKHVAISPQAFLKFFSL